MKLNNESQSKNANKFNNDTNEIEIKERIKRLTRSNDTLKNLIQEKDKEIENINEKNEVLKNNYN